MSYSFLSVVGRIKGGKEWNKNKAYETCYWLLLSFWFYDYFFIYKTSRWRVGRGVGKEVSATTSGYSGTSGTLQRILDIFADWERYLFSISRALKKIFEENRNKLWNWSVLQSDAFLYPGFLYFYLTYFVYKDMKLNEVDTKKLKQIMLSYLFKDIVVYKTTSWKQKLS